MAEYEAKVYQNEFLPVGATDVNAIVSFARRSQGVARGAAGEIIAVDTSGSMGKKLNTARATALAILQRLADGTPFALIAGTHRAYLAYPEVTTGSGMDLIDSATRARAKEALRRLVPDGGTAFGTWLKLAALLFQSASVPEPRHLTIITDGGNRNELPSQLTAAIDSCKGQFSCDVLVLDEQPHPELEQIAGSLGGKVVVMPPQDQLGPLLDLLLHQQTDAVDRQVQLRLWLPKDAQLLYLRRVAPDLEEFHPSFDGQFALLPSADWSDEEREYHLGVRLPPRSLGKEQLAARLELLQAGSARASARVIAKWQASESQAEPLTPLTLPQAPREEATSLLNLDADTGRTEPAADTQLDAGTSKLGG
ncbi:MAG: VWA domain-containing protein [Propionibacteriaceae bacterium]|jgi:hypothetical protein|nr:VWA domain-containing protein [Propionibacteriaceae bacterium]